MCQSTKNMCGIEIVRKFVSPFQGFNLFFVAPSQGVALGFPVLRFQRILTFALAFTLSGCVNSLHPYNAPSDHSLKIINQVPGKYVVRVENGFGGEHKDYPVGSDGIVSFHVPSQPRGCSIRFLGIVKIAETHSEDVQAIELLKNERCVKKLSLNDIAKLKSDSDGIPRLKVK